MCLRSCGGACPAGKRLHARHANRVFDNGYALSADFTTRLVMSGGENGSMITTDSYVLTGLWQTAPGQLRSASSFVTWHGSFAAVHCAGRLYAHQTCIVTLSVCTGSSPPRPSTKLSIHSAAVSSVFAHALPLALAIPTVADFGNRRLPELLDDQRRRKFLAAFHRKSDQGHRDYAIAVCLIDLGLRAIKVSRLRISDIDGRVITVPPAKASAGRQLPLPAHAATAIREYLRHRPSTDVEQVFVGQTVLRGRPLSTAAIAAVMDRAYRRCGLVGYFGTHRLRHSFATRLYAHGATTKEIADTGSWIKGPTTCSPSKAISPRCAKT